MSKEGTCQNCYSYGPVELHHIIHRSASKALIKYEENLIDLCHNCHDYLHHNKNGRTLDLKLKLEYQNKLEILLNKEYFTREELKNIFEINEKQLDSFCKLMKSEKGVFSREEVLRAGMGGKIIEGEEKYEQSTISI